MGLKHSTISIFQSVGLIGVPLYLYYKLYKDLRRNTEEHNVQLLNYLKHNCVVMYAKGSGMVGWPAYPGRVELRVENLNKFYEPIVYFLDSAQKTLDIAVMNINIKPVIDALDNALKRGVAVRLILDYHFMKSDKSVCLLQNSGAEILYYIHCDIDTLMHYKYAVKDYCESTKTGSILCGSMNWTVCSVIENFEDLMFSTIPTIVNALHDNYEDTWNLLQNELRVTENGMCALDKVL